MAELSQAVKVRIALGYASSVAGRGYVGRLKMQGLSFQPRAALVVAHALADWQRMEFKDSQAYDGAPESGGGLMAEDIAQIVAAIAAEGWDVWKYF